MMVYLLLVIVDTTAAPALYIVCLFLVYLFEIYRFITKMFTHIPYNRWDKYRKQTQGSMHSFGSIDLHSFDQNILSLENSLF